MGGATGSRRPSRAARNTREFIYFQPNWRLRLNPRSLGRGTPRIDLGGDPLLHIHMSSCVNAWYDADMSKTVQIRDIEDEVYAALVRRAAEEGITVPELLRREAARLAARPSVAQWLARTGRRPSAISTAEVLATLDEWRGEWPDAGR